MQDSRLKLTHLLHLDLAPLPPKNILQQIFIRPVLPGYKPNLPEPPQDELSFLLILIHIVVLIVI